MKERGKSMPKKKAVVLDTNVIVRFLVGDHEGQLKKSSEIFEQIENNAMTAILLDFVFAETVFVLDKVYRVERAKIAELLTRIVNLKGMRNSNKTLFSRALEIYRARKVDMVDCLLIAYAALHDVETVSFDRDLR